MRPWLCAVLALVACKTVPDYPLGKGGGGSGKGSGGNDGPDGGIGSDGSGSSNMLDGQVCLSDDPRAFTTCSTTAAGGIVVTLGSGSATTANDGTFTIAKPTSGGTTWTATGSTIVTSTMPFSATSNTIPAIAMTTYQDMVSANLVQIDSSQGSVIAFITENNGTPATNASAVTAPASLNPVFYDDNDKITWDTIGTSTHGAIWVPGLVPPSASMMVSNNGDTAQITIPTIPIVANSITYVTDSF